MKYTVYILKCLRTGTHCMGVTSDLSASLQQLQEDGNGQRLINPELVHVEQHEDPERAHQRLQTIRRHWRPASRWPAFSAADTATVTAALIGFSSLH